MFEDRVDAGRQLAAKLKGYEAASDAVVLGIPRGGVVVAAEVARLLDLPLGVVIAAKVGAPGNPEYAIGAVTADGDVLANPESGFSQAEVESYSTQAAEKARRQVAAYDSVASAHPVRDQTAIVVDDGLATGLTARAAVKYLRRQGAARVVLAIPVSSSNAATALTPMVDQFVAVEVSSVFAAVGQFYQSFGQTEDAEVERLLHAATRSSPGPSATMP